MKIRVNPPEGRTRPVTITDDEVTVPDEFPENVREEVRDITEYKSVQTLTEEIPQVGTSVGDEYTDAPLLEKRDRIIEYFEVIGWDVIGA